MVLDLERNHLKAGMTQQAVKGLLGEPDQPTGRRLLSYGFGMGAGYLDTYFSQRERLTHWKVSGCSCNIAFDSTAWKALRDGPDPNSPRGLMVADLERHHLKVGMTPQAVKGLLGEPELPSGRRQLSYFLGISDYRMGMDSLVIYFSQRERLTHWKVSGCSRCIAFDSPAWKAEHGNTQPENPRGLMVTDLERHHLKVGMTSQAVKGLLGEPDRPSARRLLSYNLGFWSGYGVDMDSLDIYFSQRERVTHWKVQQH